MQSSFVADGDLVVKCSCCLSRGVSHGLSQRQLCSEWVLRVILDHSENYGILLVACQRILLGLSIQENVENNLFIVPRDGIASRGTSIAMIRIFALEISSPQRAPIHTFHLSCSVTGRVSYFSFISLSLSVSGSSHNHEHLVHSIPSIITEMKMFS